MHPKSYTYVLITPARNEEAYIGNTLESVVAQTVLPKRWVIVSDGSTDRTDEIINRYVAKHDFMQLLRITRNGERDFSSKVHAINEGFKQLGATKYEFIGNLDADISLGPEYYLCIIEKFRQNQKLGIAGGIIVELDGKRQISQNISLNSVAGSIQLFRRQCYLQTGGYIPLKLGGEDAAIEIMARMQGWEVQTFPEIRGFHHRYRYAGTSIKSFLKSSFRNGVMFYVLGYHPLFYIVRSLYRVIDKPYLLGSLLQICGFLFSSMQRRERAIPEKVINYLRREQITRLKTIWIKSNESKFIHTSRTMK